MGNIEKVKAFNELLEEYSNLSIFMNTVFVNSIELDWATEIEIDGKTPEENFVLGNFGVIPGGFRTKYKHPPYVFPLQLSSAESKDRERAKIIIRRIFLAQEQTNIWDILKNNFDFSHENVGGMILRALTESHLTFGESYNELNDDFTMKLKIGSYTKNITKESLDTEPLSYFDVFILYLHGNYIHSDKDKKHLLDILTKYYSSEIIDSIVDVYLVLVLKISKLILLPASYGFLLNNKTS